MYVYIKHAQHSSTGFWDETHLIGTNRIIDQSVLLYLFYEVSENSIDASY